MFNLFNYLKLMFFKLYANLIVYADSDSCHAERIDSYGKALMVFAPIAFLSELLDVWFIENQSFSLFVAGFVFANSIIGGIAHNIKGDFKWEKFFIQTGKMAGIITLTYVVLAGLVSPIGKNVVTESLIAAFQVATLLYPGSKILKNIFIWSDGEHPPKWIMQKVYNFKENGDLKAFLGDNKTDIDETNFPTDNKF